MHTAYIITLPEQLSLAADVTASIEKTGSKIAASIFEATTPDTIEKHVSEVTSIKNYKWNWPETPSETGYDLSSGLYKPYYSAVDQRRVEACFVSHLRLWHRCANFHKPMIILEADALFTACLEYNAFDYNPYDILGLNDPRGATRRAAMFHSRVSKAPGYYPPPSVNLPNEPRSPQGIAGNSAYYITPRGATKMLALVNEYGGWPNDALMCKELLNTSIGVVYPYYTRVQGTQSTTTG